MCQGGLWVLQTRGERCPKPSQRMVSLGTELAVPPNPPPVTPSCPNSHQTWKEMPRTPECVVWLAWTFFLLSTLQ